MDPIETVGLRRSFGAVEALRGLDLSVPEGHICALLGPNGAGKTTAVRILATLVTAEAGQARVCGYDVATHPAQVRQRIGLAGQHAAVDGALTGEDNLFILGLMHHLGRRRARQRATDLLERFGLADAAHRPVKTWSGGMQRRLDLIASLIVDPPVLFMDEPTTGLDPRSRSEIWLAIRELAAAGSTILLTTQYLDEADAIAHDVVIVDGGTRVASGTPGELKDTIGTQVDVIAEHPDDVATAAEVLRRWAIGAVATDDLELTASVPAGSVTLPALVRALDSAGAQVVDVAVRRPTLDEVFLRLTGQSESTAATRDS